MLLPCEGEDSVKWSFINSLKEVSRVIPSVCLHVYDGTCLINNMIPHSCATFKEDLCALQHMHLLVFAYTIFKQISLKTFMWFYWYRIESLL